MSDVCSRMEERRREHKGAELFSVDASELKRFNQLGQTIVMVYCLNLELGSTCKTIPKKKQGARSEVSASRLAGDNKVGLLGWRREMVVFEAARNGDLDSLSKL